MAIGIHYDVPEAIGPASYLGGLGQYQARQQAVALQAQQLALQDQHVQQEIAARLYQQQQSQLAHQASQVFDANRQFGLMDLQRQANREDMSLRRDWQTADQTQQRDWHVADSATNFANSKALADAGRNFQAEQWQKQQAALWQAKSIDATEKSLDDQVKQVANNIDLVQPGDMDEFKKHYNNWNAIRSNRAIQSDPAAYGEALQTFANNFAKSGVISRMKPRLSTLEQIKSETQVEPVYAPDGTFMGNRVWTPTFRNGQKSWQPRMEQFKADGSAAIRSARTVEDYWQAMPPADREKHYEAALLEIPRNPNGGQNPSPAEVVQAAKARLAQIHGLAPGQSQIGMTPGSATSPPSGQQSMPPATQQQPPREQATRDAASQLAQLTPEQQWMLDQGGEPDIVRRVTPEKLAAISKYFDANTPPTHRLNAAYLQAAMEQGGENNARRNGVTHSAPPGGKVLHADSLPAATRSQLPILSTKEEVARFRAARGAGAPFVGPNGKVYHTN